MTTLDEEQAKVSNGATEKLGSPGTGADELGAGPTFAERWAAYAEAHPNSKRAQTLRTLRELDERAIDLPLIGKFHVPDKHDVIYVAGLAALLVIGAVELPIALVVLGGHVLVKQHSSRSLSAVGEVMEDVFGHHVV